MTLPASVPEPPDPADAGARAAGTPSVTELLGAWSGGDGRALDALLPVVYAELRRQAARALRREDRGHTLRPTEVVHEAYLRLAGQDRVAWRSRAQFFGVAAQLMRRILVDHARGRHAAKRGGDVRPVTLAAAEGVAADAGRDEADVVVRVHEALDRLAALDPEQARLVELRYFGGLTIEGTAAVLELSPATVKRGWAVARAWLRRELARP